MTEARFTISDELIRRALADLAAGPDADELVAAVLRETDTMPQARRAFWRAVGPRRMALVLIAGALLLAALVGAVAVGSGLLRLPAPPERTTIFNRAFEYDRPANVGMELTEAWDASGMSPADVGMVRNEFSSLINSDDVIGGWNRELRRVTTGFQVGGPGGDRGVTVALLDATPFGLAVWCFGPDDHWSHPPTAEEALTTYRGWTRDLVIPAPRPTTLDEYPASSLRTPAGRCPTLHPTERTQVSPEPGVLTFVQLQGSTVAVVIWGKTEAILDEWLPTATEFVKTIHFVTKEAT